MICITKNEAISPSGIYSIENNEIYLTDDKNIYMYGHAWLWLYN